MICTFVSKINENANGIVYELHDGETGYYLIKWKINSNNHETKEKKTTVHRMFKIGKYVKQ